MQAWRVTGPGLFHLLYACWNPEQARLYPWTSSAWASTPAGARCARWWRSRSSGGLQAGGPPGSPGRPRGASRESWHPRRERGQRGQRGDEAMSWPFRRRKKPAVTAETPDLDLLLQEAAARSTCWPRRWWRRARPPAPGAPVPAHPGRHRRPAHRQPGLAGPLVELDVPADVSMHVTPLDSAQMVRQFTSRLAQLQSSRTLATHKGRLSDPEVEIATSDVERLRELVQRGHEALQRQPLRHPAGPSRASLDDVTRRVEATLASMLAASRVLHHEQDSAFQSVLPQGWTRCAGYAPWTPPRWPSASPSSSPHPRPTTGS